MLTFTTLAMHTPKELPGRGTQVVYFIIFCCRWAYNQLKLFTYHANELQSKTKQRSGVHVTELLEIKSII